MFLISAENSSFITNVLDILHPRDYHYQLPFLDILLLKDGTRLSMDI